MDSASGLPAERPDLATAGVDPNAAAATAGGDWRTPLTPEARCRIVNKIIDDLAKYLPLSEPRSLVVQFELQSMAVRYEEKSDYLRKIALKVLYFENLTKIQRDLQMLQWLQIKNPQVQLLQKAEKT